MSAAIAGTSEESTPLLSKSNNHYGRRKEISILRVRIVSALVPFLAASAGSARDALLSQYMVDRLADDAGYMNHTRFNACVANTSDPHMKLSNELQTQATQLLTNYSFVQNIPAFVVCLLIGSYSDYLGRRLLLLVPVLTNLLKTVMIALIIKFNLDLRFMYLAYGIDGIAGSWFAILLALYALTADISTTTQERTMWIYLISTAQSVMEAAINIADGYLIDNIGYFDAALLLSSFMILSFLVPLFLLPETLQRPPGEMVLNPLVHMRRIFGFYVIDGSIRKRVSYLTGITIFFVGVANLVYLSSLDALYQMHEPFCWTSTKIGFYAAVRSAGAYTLGALWLSGLQRCLSNEYIGMFGALFGVGAFTFEALVKESWQFYLVPIIGSPGTVIVPVSRSVLSLQTGPDHQGALFSSIAVIETICSTISAIMWNKIYGVTVSFMPGAVYFVMAFFCLLAFFLYILYKCVGEHPKLEREVIINVDQTDIY